MTKRNKHTPGPSADSAQSSEADSKPTNVVINYRGVAGHDGQGRPVPHQDSMRHLSLMVPGVKEIGLRPGINVIDRALWDRYAAEEPVTKRLVSTGEARHAGNLDEMHTEELTALIKLTRSHDGLDWIREQEEARDDPREFILSEIDEAKGRPITPWKAKEYASVVSMGRRSTAAAPAPA